MIKICVICGKEFQPTKRNQDNAVCCSQPCNMKKWRREHPEHNRRLKIERNRRRGVHAFGSKEHREMMSRIQSTKIGVKHPNWKGGYENHLMHTKIRLARKRSNGGSFTIDQWNELVKMAEGKCVACGIKGKLTIDHIIPISKGGDSFITNIQPLCGPCNIRKRDKIINHLVCQL